MAEYCAPWAPQNWKCIKFSSRSPLIGKFYWRVPTPQHVLPAGHFQTSAETSLQSVSDRNKLPCSKGFLYELPFDGFALGAILPDGVVETLDGPGKTPGDLIDFHNIEESRILILWLLRIDPDVCGSLPAAPELVLDCEMVGFVP